MKMIANHAINEKKDHHIEAKDQPKPKMGN